MIRKTGFYYVKRCDCWEVAFYSSARSVFHVAGLQTEYKDSDFSEIKEEPVKLPEH